VAGHASAAEERARAADVSVKSEPEQQPHIEPPSPGHGRAPVPDGEMVSLASASFEQLRTLGMSVTQAKRVLNYRDRNNGFDSLDELESVPGLPEPFLATIKQRLTL
jgi:DNA uptake protein ComE-like DNA-binding protein